ncbi:hypothetical protein [Nostoc sp. 'Peltigera membranacea cyanobiont' 232]|nr:hypothetical protein [Nostoc sp. 'Peltigera membranacea cyanobiont' 232]
MVYAARVLWTQPATVVDSTVSATVSGSLRYKLARSQLRFIRRI